MCLFHRKGITLSLRRMKWNSKELHATMAARLCSTDSDLSSVFRNLKTSVELLRPRSSHSFSHYDHLKL